MKRRNILTTAAVVSIAIVSLVFNGYFVYKMLEEPPKDTNQTTKELVQAMSEIYVQSNSESGVKGESVEQLKSVIYKMPDVEKKLFLIKEMSEEGSAIYLDLDEVEWFGDKEAENAAREDGVIEPESLPNGFYIRNASNEITRIKLEPDVFIAELNGARAQSVDYADFIDEELQDRLFNITFVEDKVVVVTEKYRP